ncbi:hypothetical protein JD844_012042 [Phrynosoma platyrhinos]|uniref:C-type lectin domain-containing protein n=1 Tax=Phrynosoma platyrhinos TaxID=52577 RepID=A0ABQ7TJU1_PHRPL|nr:hypothetical protein JD844_012042 [Phrynosoma platyrhinos]
MQVDKKDKLRLQLSHPIQENIVYCVKISKRSLVGLNCNMKAHWICKRSTDVDRYQEHVGKVLLSPPGSPSQVHADLISAKVACLELREQCTGISVWNNAYALARGIVLLKSEESQSAAYVKSDCSFGYFGVNCSSVCSRCFGDELCNPYTGACENFHSCRAQDSPAVCEQGIKATTLLCGLKLSGSQFGRCVGLDSANHTALKLECDKKHKWICKRQELADLFDVYTDQFLSGPLDPMFYTSLSNAVIDCLSNSNCTGIVQDYQYFRRTTGINAIVTYDETATSYVRRECSFGYYGYNCASYCKKCYGGFRCSSITGQCPERMYCIGRFKGEMCELGIKHPKCPQNAPWWFYDGHCYYFEKKMKGPHAWANLQCSYYKDGKLARIDSAKEKEWLGDMLETESWIGLLKGGSAWKWSGDSNNIEPSKYTWLWDFPLAANGCVQMVEGGRLQALPCREHRSYICEKEIGTTQKSCLIYPWGSIRLAWSPVWTLIGPQLSGVIPTGLEPDVDTPWSLTLRSHTDWLGARRGFSLVPDSPGFIPIGLEPDIDIPRSLILQGHTDWLGARCGYSLVPDSPGSYRLAWSSTWILLSP